MWTVIVLDPQGSEICRKPLDGKMVIGRSQDCELVIPSNSVSRQHARLEVFNDRPVFVDLGSSNGSIVNGQPVNKPVLVNSHSAIQIAGHTLRLELDEEEMAKTVIVKAGSFVMPKPPATPDPASLAATQTPSRPGAALPQSPRLAAAAYVPLPKSPRLAATSAPPPATAPITAEPLELPDVGEFDLQPIKPSLAPTKPVTAPKPPPPPVASTVAGMNFLDIPSAPSPTESAPKPPAAVEQTAEALLEKQLAGIRSYRDESVAQQKAIAAKVDAEWADVVKAMKALKQKVGGNPKIHHFTFSRDEQEISVKLDDSSKRGYTYYVLSRRHPTGKYDNLDVVWMCELGGEELNYKLPKDAMNDLVRRIAGALA